MNFKHLNILVIFLSLLILVSTVYVSMQIIKYYPTQQFNESIEIPSELTGTRVIDGDTFVLQNGEIIRLICVDTPEENQEGYTSAKLFLESLVLDREVRLEADIDDKDSYGRLLRYVYVNQSGTEVFVNQEIVKYGFGKVFPYGNNTRLCDTIAN